MVLFCILLASLAAPSSPATEISPGIPDSGTRIQDIDDEALADRPIARVTIEGLESTNEQLLRNNLRTAAGQPFDSTAIREDVETLYRLGRFDTVDAEAELNPDGTVNVIYIMTEQPLIAAIQVVGNRSVSDQELLGAIPLYAGGPRDDFLLEQGMVRIKDIYRNKGYYLAEVEVDESRLKDSGILIVRIVEGPRVRIKEIEFVGNRSFPAKELSVQISTKPYIPLFRKGQLEPEKIIDDVASLDKFYKDNGFVDVRVDDRILLSPDNTEAKLVFVISEGRQYRLREVLVETTGSGGPEPILSDTQIRDLMAIRAGDSYTAPLIERSVERIEETYQLMGYVDSVVTSREVRVGEQPEVDMLIGISEGVPVEAGLIKVQGNFITKDKVIRRLVRIEPGRPLDGREIELSRRRVEYSNLFGEVRVTVQDPEGLNTRDRDVLVEVTEKNTGSFNFGVGLSSDAGVFGDISLNQRNFDVADWPLTWRELVRGRAFRGAGQTMQISAAPGDEVSTYSFTLAEPHLFNTDISASFTGYYRNRFYNQYKEERLSASVTFGRRLGDVWSISTSPRFQNVTLTNFSDQTPIEVFDDRGPDNIMNLTTTLVRTTINDFYRPSNGSRLSLSMNPSWVTTTGNFYVNSEVGLTTYITLDEDFLGRKTTLKLNGRVGYIFGGTAPVEEKYYLGGLSFRGFQFRTISPKAQGTIGQPDVPSNDPVGGDFLFFAGTEYQFPVVGDAFGAVAFIDSGTVKNDVDFEGYRVSVGVGIRLYIPQLGQAPLAFDFGFPILKEAEDEKQLFSFSMALPF
ncbi:MAG: outer membrane protein assembly factor BamA [Planctomycetota bacterium]|nr:outer membrane protein assembly factor BamA [Planctomycetota bacterium]